MSTAFYQSPADQPHPERTRAILKAHPEVRSLIGRNRWTALLMVGVIALQVAIAAFMGSLGLDYWWLALIVAYFVGAFANHCLYVIVHEAIHNLIFANRALNKLTAIIADLPNLFPGALGFGVCHLKHHAHQGDYDEDGDIASEWEARLVGNRWYMKALWLLFFPFFQITRPARLKSFSVLSGWTWVSAAAAIAFDVAIILFCGWNGFLYLTGSKLFAVGLHPLGARWIQEHYTYDPSQETYSYYGPLNIVALNLGYHNEHHDFPSIPWNRLPRLKAMAPEFYEPLKARSSWTRMLLEFIFDERFSLFSRVVRVDAGKVSPATLPAEAAAR